MPNVFMPQNNTFKDLLRYLYFDLPKPLLMTQEGFMGKYFKWPLLIMKKRDSKLSE